MDRLKLKTTDIHKLIQNKFHKISDCQYVYRFSAYKYKITTLITCVMTADIEDSTLYIDVIDTNNGTLYTPYYNNECGRNEVLDIVKTNIDREIQKLRNEKIIK